VCGFVEPIKGTAATSRFPSARWPLACGLCGPRLRGPFSQHASPFARPNVPKCLRCLPIGLGTVPPSRGRDVIYTYAEMHAAIFARFSTDEVASMARTYSAENFSRDDGPRSLPDPSFNFTLNSRPYPTRKCLAISHERFNLRSRLQPQLRVTPNQPEQALHHARPVPTTTASRPTASILSDLKSTSLSDVHAGRRVLESGLSP